jgi:hypothetical protein
MTIYEVVAFRSSTQLPASTQGTVMQVAADRWLVISQVPLPSQVPPQSQTPLQSPSLSQSLSLPELDFSMTDVTGKWREIRVGAPARALASTADVEELLAGRDCARTALFDCPAVLQRLNEGYAVWIERSYEHAFNVAMQLAASL